MTGRRARLSRLEARRGEVTGDVIGVFRADVGAGVWREVNSSGGRVRLLPLSPEDVQEAGRLGSAGGGLLMLAPLPPAMVLADVTWEER